MDGDVTAFDANFFNLSTEAARVSCERNNGHHMRRNPDASQSMDPQLRASMEGVYEAIEDGIC